MIFPRALLFGTLLLFAASGLGLTLAAVLVFVHAAGLGLTRLFFVAAAADAALFGVAILLLRRGAEGPVAGGFEDPEP